MRHRFYSRFGINQLFSAVLYDVKKNNLLLFCREFWSRLTLSSCQFSAGTRCGKYSCTATLDTGFELCTLVCRTQPTRANGCGGRTSAGALQSWSLPWRAAKILSRKLARRSSVYRWNLSLLWELLLQISQIFLLLNVTFQIVSVVISYFLVLLQFKPAMNWVVYIFG